MAQDSKKTQAKRSLILIREEKKPAPENSDKTAAPKSQLVKFFSDYANQIEAEIAEILRS